MSRECSYCDVPRGNEVCGEFDPITRYVCTRQRFHDGDHVACAATAHEIHRWHMRGAKMSEREYADTQQSCGQMRERETPQIDRLIDRLNALASEIADDADGIESALARLGVDESPTEPSDERINKPTPSDDAPAMQRLEDRVNHLFRLQERLRACRVRLEEFV